MVSMLPDVIPRTLTAVCLATVLLITYFYAPPMLSLLLVTSLVIILLYEWPQFCFWWLTPLYPVAPFMLLILLNQSPERRLLLFLFIFSALFDCAGYFVGSIFGRHKLAPRLSPGKTWEGLLAGYVTLAITYPFLAHLFALHAIGWLQIPFIITYGTLAISGDFLVSFFKRRVDIKDSSNLLPGHGGLLDRFASYLLTVIFIYTLKNYLT